MTENSDCFCTLHHYDLAMDPLLIGFQSQPAGSPCMSHLSRQDAASNIRGLVPISLWQSTPLKYLYLQPISKWARPLWRLSISSVGQTTRVNHLNLRLIKLFDSFDVFYFISRTRHPLFNHKYGRSTPEWAMDWGIDLPYDKGIIIDERQPCPRGFGKVWKVVEPTTDNILVHQLWVSNTLWS